MCSWNNAAEQIKGYKAREVLGKHVSIFYPKEEVEAGKPVHDLKIAAEQGRFEDDCWKVRKDGSRFSADVVVTNLRDQSGGLKGFGKITRDLTDAGRWKTGCAGCVTRWICGSRNGRVSWPRSTRR